MKTISIGVLVLFLLFLLFGGRTSGYGEPCGGPTHKRCSKGTGWCSVNPANGTGTCQKSKPKWATKVSVKKILAGPKML